MAAPVQNALVGLGNTIQILNQILDEVRIIRNEKSNTVQPKDMNSSNIISKISDKGLESLTSTTDAIVSVSKVNTKGLAEKTGAISNAIKTLTSKDVTSGIMKLGLLYATGIVGMFNKGITSIFKTITELNNSTRSQYKQIKNFNETIEGITKSINMLTNMILKIAALSAFLVVAIPLSLLGFAAIAVITKGLVGLYKWMAISSEEIKKYMESTNSFINSMYALSGLVLVSAAVGVVAILATKYVLWGFTAIALMTVAVVALYTGVSLAAKNINNVSKDFLYFALSLYALSGLVLVSAAVGAIAVAFFPQVAVGFISIATITFVSILLFKLVGKAGQIALSTSQAFLWFTFGMLSLSALVIVSAFVGKTVIDNFGATITGLISVGVITLAAIGIFKLLSNSTASVMMAIPAFAIVIAGLFGLAFLTSYIINIGKEIEEAGGTKNVYKVLGVMGTMLGGITLLMIGIGALVSSGIGAIILGAGAVALVAISGTILLLGKTITNINNISKEIKDPNALYQTIDVLKKAAWKMTGLILGIGALISLPLMPLIIGVASGTLLSISTVCKSLTQSVVEIINATKMLEDVGGTDAFIKKSDALTTALSNFIENVFAKLAPYKGSHKDFKKLIKPLGLIINDCSKFLKMLSRFTFVNNEIVPVFYKDNGDYKLGAPVNIVSTANHIGLAFGTFVDEIFKKFQLHDKKAAKNAKKIAKSMAVMMDPVTKFASLMKMFADSKNGNLTAYVTKNGEIVFDKKGNPKTYEINISSVTAKISASFTDFTNSLLKSLEKVDDSGISKRTAKILESSMNPINTFIDAVTKSEWDEDGTFIKDGKRIDIKTVGINIGTAISHFITNLNKSLPDGGPFSGANNKKAALEGYLLLLSGISDLAASADKLKDFNSAPILDSVTKFIKDLSGISVEADKSDKMIKILDNTAELSKTIFDNAKEKVKNLKEYYENTKLIAEQLERTATAMEKISKYQDLAINIKNNGNNNTGSQNSTPTQYSSNSNNVTNVTNVNNSAQPTAINNQSSEPDYSLIANAIKEGFGDITKLTVVLDSGDELDLSLAFGK